jgi:hypothetical protein
MFYYPWTKLMEDARHGDLFLCHIVREAKALIDPDLQLAKLQSAFEFRANYQLEIKQATDLGWFLIRYGSNVTPHLLVKRMIWCVRTILIARSAEVREPVFAPLALAKWSGSAFATEVLKERHSRQSDPAMLKSFKRFLLSETDADDFYVSATVEAFVERFNLSSNKVAMQTIRQKDEVSSVYA